MRARAQRCAESVESPWSRGVDRRRLRGRDYTIVKVFYDPEELGAKLDGLGWEADVRSAGSDLLYGTAKARTA